MPLWVGTTFYQWIVRWISENTPPINGELAITGRSHVSGLGPGYTIIATWTPGFGQPRHWRPPTRDLHLHGREPLRPGVQGPAWGGHMPPDDPLPLNVPVQESQGDLPYTTPQGRESPRRSDSSLRQWLSRRLVAFHPDYAYGFVYEENTNVNLWYRVWEGYPPPDSSARTHPRSEASTVELNESDDDLISQDSSIGSTSTDYQHQRSISPISMPAADIVNDVT
ncbi:MAG: hypothetical protein M1831_002363 [Alyxoria varia]|nr:MAG: hypothetical protein M1831_002363 [Alyxoria varia]